MLKRQPYAGSTCRLALAFDIGDAWSGISFCILQPGDIPQPEEVTRYPGQDQSCDFRVPSVMYYDSKGDLKATGYEAFKDDVVEKATSEGWAKLEWWRLHLRPKQPFWAHIKDNDIPPLPNGKTIVHILQDFIKYLFQCAENYIKTSYTSHVWESVKNEIQFVFTYPNGWEDARQHFRRAIELAGLVPISPAGRARVHFLSEGEAGLHFCIWDLFASGIPNQEECPKGQGVIIIDAGGGIISLSMHSMKYDPISFEEITPPECRLQGSVFVTRRAKTLLKRKLQGSRYATPEMIEEMTNTFDRTKKLKIHSAEQPVYIKVGNFGDDDSVCNIKAGKLKLTGQEVTKLFDDSINAVIDAFEQQRSRVTIPITMAFLIGEFGASDWLRSRLQSYFKSQDIELSRPNRVHEVIPNGAILSIIGHLTRPREVRSTHGTMYAVFRGLLHKGIQINNAKEFHYPFCSLGRTLEEFGVEAVHILRYRGSLSDPQWIHHEESFSTLCTIHVDLAEVAKTISPRSKPFGPEGFCYILHFEAVVSYGAGKFRAQVSWKVNGIETRSPAMVIYEN